MNNFIFKRLNVKEFYEAETKKLVENGHEFHLRLERTGYVIHTCNPQAIKEILLKGDKFPKYDYNTSNNEDGSFFHEFVGFENVLMTNGSTWKKHRMIVNPAFKTALPSRLFGDCTRDLFKLWDNEYANEPFDSDIHNITERLTLQIIGKAAFDFDFNAILDEKSIWKQTYDGINKAASDPLFILFPILEEKFLWLFPKRQQSFKLLNEWKKMLLSIIEKKREAIQNNVDHGVEEAEKDLLTLMIESEHRGEGALSNEELLSDLIIFFIAGHDTTAFALSAAIYYLAKHPDIQEKARQEAISVLCPNGEVDEDIFPTTEDTKHFVYINQIMKETLRINGSVLFLLSPRLVTQDVNLSGVFIPKGSQINVNIHEVHHNPNVWHDPETFDPDRWASNGEAEQLAGKGMAWVPFSNGNRQCIGMNFSLLEQRVILGSLLRKYEWTLPEDSIHQDYMVNKFNLIPKPIDLKIRFKRRY
uniref:Cytochrome P-450 cyp509A1 n=1 Tax=Cunninghamella elegans TaxID=4853 RepID=Q9P493_CUNEL|nr:cytochrome P-450 cyp509A1 [Cunninghamella elegans]